MKSPLILLGFLALAVANGKSLRSNNGISKMRSNKRISAEKISAEEADKCCAFTFDQWDCSNQRKQVGKCKGVYDIKDFKEKATILGARRGDLNKRNKEKTVLKYLMRKKGCTFGPAASSVSKSEYEKRCPATDDLDEEEQAKDLKESMDMVSNFVWGDTNSQSNCAIYSGTALTMMGKRTKKKIADIDALCHSVPEEAVGDEPKCLSVETYPIEEMVKKKINLEVKSCPYNPEHPEWFPVADCAKSGDIGNDFKGNTAFLKSKIKDDCQAADEDHFERHMVGLKTETDFFPLPMTEGCNGEDLKKKPCVVLKKWKNNLLDETKINFKGKDEKYQGACALGHVFEGQYPLVTGPTFQFMGIMDQLLFKRYLRDFAKCLPKRCGCDDDNLPADRNPDAATAIPNGKEGACKAEQDEEDCVTLVRENCYFFFFKTILCSQ